MHGDDVASAGVSVSTQIVSKATEIFLDMLKVAIEKERKAARLKQSENQQTVLSDGEVHTSQGKGADQKTIDKYLRGLTDSLIKHTSQLSLAYQDDWRIALNCWLRYLIAELQVAVLRFVMCYKSSENAGIPRK